MVPFSVHSPSAEAAERSRGRTARKFRSQRCRRRHPQGYSAAVTASWLLPGQRRGSGVGWEAAGTKIPDPLDNDEMGGTLSTRAISGQI